MKNYFFQIQIPVSILKEKNRYVAYSPALDLSTSGKTIQQTKKRFSQIVGIFFEELTENQTLDSALSDLGWRKTDKKWKPPKIISQKSESIKIPVSV